jgi:trans-aconitate 2-methyltransferase
MPDWDPNLYLKFSDQRARPAADLIAQIRIENPAHIIDLGCGTGNSTEQLHRRWPEAALTGLDSSATMLAQAQHNHPDWHWIKSTIEEWAADTIYELVFSNAALHWVPDHARLFPRLLSYVALGGALAVQMPNNFRSPAHQAMRKAAADPRWSAAVAGASENTFVEPLSSYYDALRRHASAMNIWETEYLQIMDGPGAVLDWMRSTAMRPWLVRLADDKQRKQFEELCLKEIEQAYPANDQGKVIFPYKRIFIIAYR